MLRVKNLNFSYNERVCLENLSLELPAGKITGILGANGAGKTTLIECLEGARAFDSGQIFFEDKEIDENYRQSISIQFQEASFFSKLKVKEVLGFSIDLFKSEEDLSRILRRFELLEHGEKFYEDLSGGMKQKLALAVASINTKAKIVFLDEPTSGLDVFFRRKLWNIIRGFKAEGKTVLLTTHYIEEAEQLCDHVVIMNAGRIVEQDPPELLMRKYCVNYKIEVETAQDIDVRDFLEKIPDVVKLNKNQGLGFSYEIILHSGCTGDSAFGKILGYMAAAKNKIVSCRMKHYDLETAMLTILGYTLNSSGEICE